MRSYSGHVPDPPPKGRAPKKRGRSSIEWLGVIVHCLAQTIPVVWVLAAILLTLLVKGCVEEEVKPLMRIQW